MPIASTNPTLNAVVHAEGKPFRLADYFSILLDLLRSVTLPCPAPPKKPWDNPYPKVNGPP